MLQYQLPVECCPFALPLQWICLFHLPSTGYIEAEPGQTPQTEFAESDSMFLLVFEGWRGRLREKNYGLDLDP